MRTRQSPLDHKRKLFVELEYATRTLVRHESKLDRVISGELKLSNYSACQTRVRESII